MKSLLILYVAYFSFPMSLNTKMSSGLMQLQLLCLSWCSVFTVQHRLRVLNKDNQETGGEIYLSKRLKSNQSLLLYSAQGCSDSIHVIQMPAEEYFIGLLSDLLRIKMLGFFAVMACALCVRVQNNFYSFKKKTNKIIYYNLLGTEWYLCGFCMDVINGQEIVLL